MRVFVQGGASTPSELIRLLWEENADPNLELMHLHLMGDPLAHLGSAGPKRTQFFVGPELRKFIDYDRIDYLPCFLSEIPRLLSEGPKRPDLTLVQVSPPNADGLCSLGPSVDVTRAAVDAAKVVWAQINPQVPEVSGDGFVPPSRFARTIHVDRPLPEAEAHSPSEEERAIGQHAASIIEDGSTLQMGIGAIPEAVLGALKSHRHLGIHTEMFTDALIPLIESGAIDNSKKKNWPGVSISGFVTGMKRTYQYLHQNSRIVLLDIAYVNNPAIIAQNPKVVAINSAVEIDLTGQVCADSVGFKLISGVGGQLDFMRGAALSSGGKPIIALTSRTKSGRAKIVSSLSPGAGVVTTRADVHYVITEHGIANLYGKTLGERARALIRIAHPEDRDGLQKAFFADHQ
jgi:4-hydroxybutyrate CoA-transferase